MVFLLEWFDKPNENILKFRNYLDSINVDYFLIDLKGEPVIIDNQYLLPVENSQDIIDNLNEINPSIYGGKKLTEFSHKHLLAKNYDSPKLDYQYLVENFPAELVSKNIQIGSLNDLDFNADSKFIRPNKCNKKINGQIISKSDFESLLAVKSFENESFF